MAAIVYEGVGGGGSLFEGLKIFLVQRVPSRDTWISLIKENGGEVVKIDKLADYVIADHARKDAPVGSLSWKWIEASVREGEIQDEDKYRAGPAQGHIRPVASGLPTRKGRVKFTDEDDRILMNWVAKAERQGISTLGNELYKELEAMNNRHTFQSWRDRWIKHFQHRPSPDHLDKDEPSPNPPSSRRTAPRSSAPVPARNAPVTASPSKEKAKPAPQKLENARKENGNPFVAKSKGGNEFTKEEEDLLLESYEAILNLDEDQVINAWSAWSAEYPNHTPQEWRNHFIRHMIPKVTRMRQRGDDDVVEPKVELPSSPPPVHRSSPKRSMNSMSTQAPAKAREIKDSQGSSGKTFTSQSPVKRWVDPTTVNERLFEGHMRALAAELELDLDFLPVISGRKISLWRIWQVVMSEQFGGSDEVTGRRWWPRVAKELNFNEFRDKEAPQQLKECYDEILADFEMARKEFRDQTDMTDSQEATTSQLIAEQLLETSADYEMEQIEEENEQEEETPSSALGRMSSPTGKRSFRRDLEGNGTPHHKKQRIDKGKGKEVEIPSTPEEILNGTQFAHPPPGPSPLKHKTPAADIIDLDDEDEDDDDDDIGLFVKASPTPRPSRPVQRKLEPETQDFSFAPAEIEKGQAEEHNDSWQEISSSHSTDAQSDTLSTFMDRYISFGYAGEIVAEALEATTMELENVGQVIEDLAQGKGIPEGMPGVWTQEDDEALDAGQESNQFASVVSKHGVERIELRRKFLKEQMEVGQDEEGAGS